jgi:signal transduction histidine kinase
MRNLSIRFILGLYIKSRLKVIFAFCLFILIFLIVYYLYHLPLEPIVYSLELVTALALIFGIFDFLTYYRKHKLLYLLLPCITTDVDKLPHAKELIEIDYQKLITALYLDRTQLVSQSDNKQTEMVDYYTLWAHQIKTPISAMRLLLQTEESSSQYSAIEQELFKIEQYVGMVLHYLKLESMSADLLLKEYPLLDIIKQAVKKYTVIFIHKNISLNLEDIHCSVLTDEKWLVFVLEQMISNSLKYTNEGCISIYMDKTAEKTLIIEDTGIGIHAEDIPRIFEKGFTGFNGRMDKKSTGIGLYLCKQVLSKLSHTLTVTSQVGKGTRISIDLSSAKIDYH